MLQGHQNELDDVEPDNDEHPEHNNYPTTGSDYDDDKLL
jgi:hypothetical protein